MGTPEVVVDTTIPGLLLYFPREMISMCAVVTRACLVDALLWTGVGGLSDVSLPMCLAFPYPVPLALHLPICGFSYLPTQFNVSECRLRPCQQCLLPLLTTPWQIKPTRCSFLLHWPFLVLLLSPMVPLAVNRFQQPT